jgi:hypothetical protein
LPQLTLGAEGLVRLQWIASPEPDLARYLLYRTGDEGAAADVRTMSLIARVAPRPTSIPGPGEQLPIAVPGKPDWLEFHDSPAPGAFFFYRLQAEDTAANRSQGSTTFRGRALKAPPSAPVWNDPTRNGNTVLLSWTHPSDQHLSCLVERRAAGVARWDSVSGWLPRGQYSFVDTPPTAATASEYRLRVRDELGQVSTDWPIVLVD